MMMPVNAARIARTSTMPITLATAAKLCGLDKSTLRKAVRDGRISGTRDEHGVWQVEIAEVERIYPVVPTADPQALPRSSIPASAPAAEFRTGDAATDLMVKTLQGVIERMGKDLDRERDRVDQLTAQLTRLAERSLPAPPPGPELSHLRRAWRWMRRAG
jgi:hypothetical protein